MNRVGLVVILLMGAACDVPAPSRRVVHLSSPGGDTSCLRHGGTVVAKELSDDDVREIEKLIRQVDALPIVMIGHRVPVEDRAAGELEFDGVTGERCGPLSGQGSFYWIRRIDSGWVVTENGGWIS